MVRDGNGAGLTSVEDPQKVAPQPKYDGFDIDKESIREGGKLPGEPPPKRGDAGAPFKVSP